MIDPDVPWVLDPAELKSKCKNTPFDEARMTGRVVRTIVAGRTVYELRMTARRSPSRSAICSARSRSALVLTRAAGGPDLRAIGSGNIGATNVLRTGSKALAAATLLGDMLKGTAAVLLAAHFFGREAALAAGLGAFLGHLFPVWLKFKGGKGVATYIGVLLGLAWPAALIFGAIWLAVACRQPLFLARRADRQRADAARALADRPPRRRRCSCRSHRAAVVHAPRQHRPPAATAAKARSAPRPPRQADPRLYLLRPVVLRRRLRDAAAPS